MIVRMKNTEEDNSKISVFDICKLFIHMKETKEKVGRLCVLKGNGLEVFKINITCGIKLYLNNEEAENFLVIDSKDKKEFIKDLTVFFNLKEHEVFKLKGFLG